MAAAIYFEIVTPIELKNSQEYNDKLNFFSSFSIQYFA